MRRRSRAGGEPVKTRRRKAVTLKRGNAPKTVRRRSSSAASQETEVARLTRERERGAGAADGHVGGARRSSVSSPGDLEPVFDNHAGERRPHLRRQVRTVSSAGTVRFCTSLRRMTRRLPSPKHAGVRPASSTVQRRLLVRMVATKTVITRRRSCGGAGLHRTTQPNHRRSRRTWRCADDSVCPDAEGGRTDRCVHPVSPRSSSLCRQADRAW